MADGTESVAPAAAEAQTPGPEAAQNSAPAGDGNPAWGELRTQVGEPTFRLIQPHLQKWESSANGRIQKSSEELKRYTDLGDYDSLQAGRSIYQQLDSDPVAFAQNLIGMLQERGMWEAAEAIAQAADEEDGEEPDPRDQRIAQLEAAMERFQGVEEQRSSEQQVAQWQSDWASAFEQAQQANPWLDDSQNAVLRTLARGYVETGDEPIADIFGKALADLASVRNQAMSAPRANATAPRLVPVGGGNPAAAQQPDTKSMSRTSTQDLVAARIAAALGR